MSSYRLPRWTLSLMAGALIPGLLSSNALAQTNSASLSGDDQKFVQKAAVGGLTEVALGKIAQQNAASEPVKRFGEHMVQDHTKANADLKKVADAKGVQLPVTLDGKHQRDVDKFSKLSGADFDKRYTAYMVDDHKKDIADFGKAAKSGSDAEVRGFASKTLPTLQMHLKMAQDAQAAVKGTK